MKYQEILDKGSQILRANNIKSSNLDCELILSKVLNKKREEILINLNNKINNNQKSEFIYYLNIIKYKSIIWSNILNKLTFIESSIKLYILLASYKKNPHFL